MCVVIISFMYVCMYACVCIYIYVYVSFHDLQRSPHSLNSLRSLPFSMRKQRGSRPQICTKLLSVFTGPTGHPDHRGGALTYVKDRTPVRSDSSDEENFPKF